VVIGGASLTGGLASPLSTFAAALFLTGLNQMLRTMGLPTALQFVVFGAVIIGGMLVSGDRIVRGVEHLLRERRGDASRRAVLADSADGRAWKEEGM
jgi:ribose transport system permease protein